MKARFAGRAELTMTLKDGRVIRQTLDCAVLSQDAGESMDDFGARVRAEGMRRMAAVVAAVAEMPAASKLH